MWQNSYDGSPSVYIVPTPIGNLGDITNRALETLKNVDVIFSEDTRVTLQLLNYFNIKILYMQHLNTKKAEIIFTTLANVLRAEREKQGKSIRLLADE